MVNEQQTNEHKILLEIAQRNDREYEEYLRNNDLEKNWDSWDMFTDKKWNY